MLKRPIIRAIIYSLIFAYLCYLPFRLMFVAVPIISVLPALIAFLFTQYHMAGARFCLGFSEHRRRYTVSVIATTLFVFVVCMFFSALLFRSVTDNWITAGLILSAIPGFFAFLKFSYRRPSFKEKMAEGLNAWRYDTAGDPTQQQLQHFKK